MFKVEQKQQKQQPNQKNIGIVNGVQPTEYEKSFATTTNNNSSPERVNW